VGVLSHAWRVLWGVRTARAERHQPCAAVIKELHAMVSVIKYEHTPVVINRNF
jgi:hypothetical protein